VSLHAQTCPIKTENFVVTQEGLGKNQMHIGTIFAITSDTSVMLNLKYQIFHLIKTKWH